MANMNYGMYFEAEQAFARSGGIGGRGGRGAEGGKAGTIKIDLVHPAKIEKVYSPGKT